MQMYKKDSTIPVTVEPNQVKVLEKAGWTTEPEKVEEKKVETTTAKKDKPATTSTTAIKK